MLCKLSGETLEKGVLGCGVGEGGERKGSVV